MQVLEVYVASDAEARKYRDWFVNAGAPETIVRVVDEPWMNLPAVRTERNLHQGVTSLGYILGLLSSSPPRRSDV
jgi:hypothetical protein